MQSISKLLKILGAICIAERAIDQMALLVMETGTRMGWDDVTRYVRKSLDVIVQLRRADGMRNIDSVARLF